MKYSKQQIEKRIDLLEKQIEKVIDKLTEQLPIKDKAEFKYLMSRLLSLIFLQNHFQEKHLDKLLQKDLPKNWVIKNK